MITKKCLWDDTHEFEVKDGEEYKVLCPKCYYNIYINTYGERYVWYDFIRNINLFKKLHALSELIDDNSDFNVNYDFINKQIQSVEKKCRMCGKTFHTGKDEDFRYLCKACYKKFYLPLKDYFSVKEIEVILTTIKNDGGDMVAALNTFLQNNKEKLNQH